MRETLPLCSGFKLAQFKQAQDRVALTVRSPEAATEPDPELVSLGMRSE